MTVTFIDEAKYELPVHLVLSQIRWVQSLHTNGDKTLGISAKAFSSNLVVRQGALVKSLSFEILFGRGSIDRKSDSFPTDACGWLTYHPEWRPTDVVKGKCALSNDLYDDIWQKLGAGDLIESSVRINAGPVHAFAGEDVVWHNDDNKPLFIVDAEFHFIRMERSSSFGERLPGFLSSNQSTRWR